MKLQDFSFWRCKLHYYFNYDYDMIFQEPLVLKWSWKRIYRFRCWYRRWTLLSALISKIPILRFSTLNIFKIWMNERISFFKCFIHNKSQTIPIFESIDSYIFRIEDSWKTTANLRNVQLNSDKYSHTQKESTKW